MPPNAVTKRLLGGIFLCYCCNKNRYRIEKACIHSISIVERLFSIIEFDYNNYSHGIYREREW